MKKLLATRVVIWFVYAAIFSSAVMPQQAFAQRSGTDQDWEPFVRTPAVSGYEQKLAEEIREKLKGYSPRTDNVGNVYVTLGSGPPSRLIVTPIDEPGYVVSEITSDGDLRVQRLPQAPPNAVFDLLHAAQPVWVITRDGKRVNGVFAGLSVHLQPARRAFKRFLGSQGFVGCPASAATFRCPRRVYFDRFGIVLHEMVYLSPISVVQFTVPFMMSILEHIFLVKCLEAVNRWNLRHLIGNIA
jgi:hypothetical protein